MYSGILIYSVIDGPVFFPDNVWLPKDSFAQDMKDQR